MKSPITAPTPSADDLSQADPAGAAVSTKPQLDHDDDGVAGGAAAPPRHQHAVVLKDSKQRGLVSGEVIAVSSDDIKDLLHKDVVRNATAEEVELAQPRVRLWTA